MKRRSKYLQIFKFISIVICFSVIPKVSMAQKIIVAYGTYKNITDESESPARVSLIVDKIVSVIKDSAELEVVRIENQCVDQENLVKLAEVEQASQGITVLVKEDTGQFSFEYILLEDIYHREHLDSFSETLEKIGEITQEVIGKLKSQETTAKTTEENFVEEPVVDEQRERKKRLKILTGVSLGITVSCAVVGGVTSALAMNSRDELRRSEEWTSIEDWNKEKKRYDGLTISSWVMWSAAGVFAATTTTLAIFAYKKTKGSTTAAPVVTNEGAVFVIKGSF